MRERVVITHPGGPEALALESFAPTAPGPGELLIRQTAVGVNFIDIYHRSGLYKLPDYPAGIGLEAAGVVEALGQGGRFAIGDRVAYSGGPPGSYATHRVMEEKHLVRIPAGISDEIAAAALLKGMTAHYLLRQTFRVKKGDVILVHAAAGGVGLILCQMAKHFGVTVIGAVGSDDKAMLAKENGCDYPIVYTRESVPARVKDITKGQGVDAVYDSVGKATFMASLDCLKKFGLMVSYGNASGAVPPFEPAILAQKGSLYLTRPSLMHYIEDRAVYEQGARELFDLIGQGGSSKYASARATSSRRPNRRISTWKAAKQPARRFWCRSVIRSRTPHR